LVVTTDVEVEAVRHCADALAVHRVAGRQGLALHFVVRLFASSGAGF
jgi:hypothetical protein